MTTHAATVRPSQALDRVGLTWTILVIGWWALWIMAFHEAALGAVRVWYQNETFHHGFLVLPIFVWIVMRDRHRYPMSRAAWNPIIISGVCIALVTWAVGFIGQILVVQQLAAVALVAGSAGLAFGWRFLLAAWFPLALLFLAVPIGEEIIPQLQVITAALAVELLKLSGISVWVEDLYLHVSAGVFHVAAACSGIKFLMSSVFFGFVACYLQFQKPAKRAAYMTFCLLAPIAANVIRVYLTILVGVWFGMEHVEGFDHLLYGWVLFALIFVAIVWVAIRFGDRGEEGKTMAPPAARSLSASRAAAGFVPVLAVLLAGSSAMQFAFSSDLRWATVAETVAADWQPHFPGATNVGFVSGDGAAGGLDVFIAEFRGDESEGELVSSRNRLVSGEGWSISSQRWAAISGDVRATWTILSTADGDRRAVLSWYELPGGEIQDTAIAVKLHQVLNVLKGLGRGGRFVAVSSPLQDSTATEDVPADLLSAAREMITGSEQR